MALRPCGTVWLAGETVPPSVAVAVTVCASTGGATPGLNVTTTVVSAVTADSRNASPNTFTGCGSPAPSCTVTASTT